MKQNILIVDDEPDIRDVISVILNDEGYNTYCVSNVELSVYVYSLHFAEIFYPIGISDASYEQL